MQKSVESEHINIYLSTSKQHLSDHLATSKQQPLQQLNHSEHLSNGLATAQKRNHSECFRNCL